MSTEVGTGGGGGSSRPERNEVSLRLRSGPLVGPVLCRVVSMVLARANCPLDRIEDAMLICDAIATNAEAHVRDGHLLCTIATSPDGADLRVSELSTDGARGLLSDAELPGVGNVLERVADELRVEAAQEGASEDLLLGLRFA